MNLPFREIYSYPYTRPSGVVVKIKLMRIVGQDIQPADFALQRWPLRVPYGVPSNETIPILFHEISFPVRLVHYFISFAILFYFLSIVIE